MPPVPGHLDAFDLSLRCISVVPTRMERLPGDSHHLGSINERSKPEECGWKRSVYQIQKSIFCR